MIPSNASQFLRILQKASLMDLQTEHHLESKLETRSSFNNIGRRDRAGTGLDLCFEGWNRKCELMQLRDLNLANSPSHHSTGFQ